MSYRSRWYEYLCYRPLLERYFEEDPNMRWEAAPKPRLTDRSYRMEFWKEWRALNSEQKLERAMKKEWAIKETEPLFDAADVARCGKDLFIQRSTVTNAAGIDWLKRHFPALRVHTVSFREESLLISTRPLSLSAQVSCFRITNDPLSSKRCQSFSRRMDRKA